MAFLKTFFISDTHFGHSNILKFEPEYRVFDNIKDHDDKIVDNWNSVVNKGDTVWHLGDVLFGTHSFDILSRLNGIKRLVLGNHDHYPIERYKEHFSKIFGVASFKECILSHVPVHPNQFYRFKKNIHGHIHSKVIDDPNYFNVSVERINLTPITYSQIMEQ